MRHPPWIKENLILLVHAGSRAYGTNTEKSDTDLKGVVIPPVSVRNHLFQRFDMAEHPAFLVHDYAHLINPNNPVMDGVVYGLTKFVRLAAEVNPNVMEQLFADDRDVVRVTPVGARLRAHRHLFLSIRAAFTTTGYAYQQLNRIERHRKFLLDPPKNAPLRADFGLPPERPRQFGEIERYLQTKFQDWNLNPFNLAEEERAALKEAMWEFAEGASGIQTHWQNWRRNYERGAIEFLVKEFNLSADLGAYLAAEQRFCEAQENWESYQRWVRERNPERKAIEEKFKFDCKHASHLVRLLRTGFEVITEGIYRVRRPDAQELLAIRNGAWSYEETIAYAKHMEQRIMEVKDQSPLPKQVNHEAINALHQELLEEHDHQSHT